MAHRTTLVALVGLAVHPDKFQGLIDQPGRTHTVFHPEVLLVFTPLENRWTPPRADICLALLWVVHHFYPRSRGGRSEPVFLPCVLSRRDHVSGCAQLRIRLKFGAQPTIIGLHKGGLLEGS